MHRCAGHSGHVTEALAQAREARDEVAASTADCGGARRAEESAKVSDTDNAEELDDQERAERLSALQGLLELMRPAVQADGGDLVLVSADVVSGVIEVQLQGACSSCAVSSSTLQGGVERILKGRLAWVTEVIGGVDDSDLAHAPVGTGGWVPKADH